MTTINWGIIGCGDVAEIKSGPAFQKAKDSALLAVMRRNTAKAKDFASRHKVPLWYDTIEGILSNNQINAVYIASPPNTHLKYALKALDAGKYVYLEKPMTLTAQEAIILQKKVSDVRKLTVAHYRRELPAFKEVKNLINSGAIGTIRFADIQILQPLKSDVIATTENQWRLDPSISGGGYFHDLAPHQLDLMHHYFGEIDSYNGDAINQSGHYQTEDMVSGFIAFKNGVRFRGVWNFNCAAPDKKDSCKIYGSRGSLEFSFFGDQIILKNEKGNSVLKFSNPDNIQLPMIQCTVEYFLGRGSNPCSVEDGVQVMKIMDSFVSNK